MKDVFASAGEEIVEAEHFIAFANQPLTKMRPDEPRATSYQNPHLSLLFLRRTFSRKDAKAQSAIAFPGLFFAPLRLCVFAREIFSSHRGLQNAFEYFRAKLVTLFLTRDSRDTARPSQSFGNTPSLPA